MRLWAGLVSSFCLPAARQPWNFGPVGHLPVAKSVWREVVREGDTVIDATCGRGQDSLSLARLCLSPSAGHLLCMDIQQEAVDSTRERLRRELDAQTEQRVRYVCGSHAVFPADIGPQSVRLVCYNLGYLPGKPRNDSNDGVVITKTDSTLRSVSAALALLRPAGLLSVTAYPGHAGGDEEKRAVEELLSSLSPQDWRVYSHAPLNRPSSPVLLLAFKIDKHQQQQSSSPPT